MPVAQWSECPAVNRNVLGSNPSGYARMNFVSKRRRSCFCFWENIR